MSRTEDQITEDGEDPITRLKAFAPVEKSACDWAIKEIATLRAKLAAHEEAMGAAVWALNNCKKKGVKICAAIGLLRARLEENK
jgi:hypothetical protein